MQLLTTFTLGAAGLQTALVSSFTSGPVAISPRFAFVSQHPYRNAVDSTYPLRTPLCVAAKTLVEESDEALLTPETYADSQSAESEVEHIIMDAAVEAFEATDFTTEPHLPPELENCEVIYADDGEEDESSSSLPTDSQTVSFQRALLAQQLAYNTKKSEPAVSEETQEVSKKQEAFQRSLLAARLSTDTAENSLLEAEEEFLQKDSQMNWMESEVRAASLGGKESLPFHDSAAMATRSADLADAENMAETTPAAFSATDQVAAAKRKIGVTPVIADWEVAKSAGKRSSKHPPADLEIQSYVTKRGVELTKERMRQKLGVSTDDNKEAPSKSRGLVVRKLAAGTEDSVTTYLSAGEKSKVQTVLQSALDKLLHTGLLKRLSQPKILIFSVLLGVLCRSLALAWFGNPAMRLK
mmetsp:Transcript_3693/g.5667  ORF Transcript_3693/g.5667 Transcript_3693/m.5667 type:complete len:412 (-) Transcript_3693:722-1957(-)